MTRAKNKSDLGILLERTKTICDTIKWGIVTLGVVISVAIVTGGAVMIASPASIVEKVLLVGFGALVPSVPAWRCYVKFREISLAIAHEGPTPRIDAKPKETPAPQIEAKT